MTTRKWQHTTVNDLNHTVTRIFVDMIHVLTLGFLSLSLSLSVYILFILYKDIHIDINMFGNVDVFGLAIDAKTLILGNP